LQYFALVQNAANPFMSLDNIDPCTNRLFSALRG